jgi:hypothetical protein
MVTLWVRNDDYSLAESWRLVEWCIERGATELTLSFFGPPNPPVGAWDAVDIPLAPFRFPDGPVERFVLNPESVGVLREILDQGLFTYHRGAAVSLEDPILIRNGVPLLTVITHEGEAVLEIEPHEQANLDSAALPYRLTSRWD